MLVNSCARVAAAARVDDRHQVVRAEPLLDELARGPLDPIGAAEQRVEIVDHHDVDAPLEGARVGSDVGLDGLAGAERALEVLDGNVDERERRDRLRLPVLEDLEIILRQVAHEAALAIGDAGVHFDVVDPYLESRTRLRRRRLARGGEDAGGQDEQAGDRKASVHRGLSHAPPPRRRERCWHFRRSP